MHKILIVDDEKPARDFISELVTSFIPNAKVTQIDHPKKAFDCVLKEDFDMLFLDICMPGMTGLELLEKIQRAGKDPYTVIISAHRDFDYAMKGIELGIVKYITKPLHKEKIFEAISLYLQKMQTDRLEIKIPKGTLRLNINHIVAIQSVERGKVKIYTSDMIIPYVLGKLSYFSALLPPHFIYIRRDCMVNLHAIKNYNAKAHEIVVHCENHEISFPVSRENMRKLRIEEKGAGSRDNL
ncbi:MAG: response regulator [Lentimicrobiaceae bacterium]|nr:response regulator [Lentimicrobiaceae bacterium]